MRYFLQLSNFYTRPFKRINLLKLSIFCSALFVSVIFFRTIDRSVLIPIPWKRVDFILVLLRHTVFLSTRWSICPIYVHLSDWYLWLGDQWITTTASTLWHKRFRVTQRSRLVVPRANGISCHTLSIATRIVCKIRTVNGKEWRCITRFIFLEAMKRVTPRSAPVNYWNVSHEECHDRHTSRRPIDVLSLVCKSCRSRRLNVQYKSNPCWNANSNSLDTSASSWLYIDRPIFKYWYKLEYFII